MDKEDLNGVFEPVRADARGGVQLCVRMMQLVNEPQKRKGMLCAVVPIENKINKEDINENNKY